MHIAYAVAQCVRHAACVHTNRTEVDQIKRFEKRQNQALPFQQTFINTIHSYWKEWPYLTTSNVDDDNLVAIIDNRKQYAKYVQHSGSFMLSYRGVSFFYQRTCLLRLKVVKAEQPWTINSELTDPMMPSFSSSGYSAGTIPVVSMLFISSRKPETVTHVDVTSQSSACRWSALETWHSHTWRHQPVVNMLLISSRKPETVTYDAVTMPVVKHVVDKL